MQRLLLGWHSGWCYKLRTVLWTRIAGRVLTVSEASKKDILRLCHVSDQQAVVTHLGTDGIYDGQMTPEEVRGVLEKHHLSGKKYVVNISGLSQKRRNPDFILEGFSLFRRHAIQDVYLCKDVTIA